MGDQNPQDFAEKVLQSLKKSSRAVDLSDKSAEKPVVEKSPVNASATSSDFTAYFNQQDGGGLGPATGGNKDLVIIPGFGGAASTSVSQINLYWNAPAIPDSTGVDTNVRATIYNYAISPGSGVTHSVIVFGGYNGSTHYKPTPNYGGGTGVTARIWLNPFRGSFETDFLGLNATGVASTTDAGLITYDSTQNKLRVGVGIGAGSAKTVAFTDDVQAASGAATTAQNIHMQVGANNVNHSVAFSLLTTGAGVALSSDAELLYNPSSNTLTFSNASVSGTINSTTIPTSKTLVVTTDKLNVLAATSSSELAGVISDETGSGALVFANTPTLVTPVLGVATATSINKVAFTAPATSATLALANSSTLSTVGGFGLTLTTTAATNVTFPTAGTLTTAGNNLGVFAATTSSQLAGVISDETGSGALVFATSPSLTTPTLGVASATSINKVAFTAPTTSATLTLFDGSTLATSGANSLTLTTTAATNVTFPTAGTLTTTGNKLSVFAATTSSELAGVISDETGSGALVFATSPSLTTPTLGVASATSINKVAFTAPATSATLTLANGSTLATSGANSLTLTTTAATNVTFPTAGTLTTTGNKLSVFAATTSSELAGVISDETGSGALVFANTPTLVTPNLGVASATSVTANSVRIGNAARTVDTSTGNLILDSNSGQTDINDNVVISGNLTVQGTTITVDSTVSTIVDPVIVVGSGVGGTHSTADNNMDRGIEFRWSNAGTATTGFFGFDDSAGKFTFIPNATVDSANVYSGTVGTIVANFEGSFTGTITGTATTAQNIHMQAGANNVSHSIPFSLQSTGSGVALSSDAELLYNPSSNTLTFTNASVSGTINSTTIPTSKTLVVTTDKLNVHAATSSSELAGVISDETGSGALVFANTPTLVTPVLGVASATSINKVAFTAPTTAATLTLFDGSTLATSGANSLTLTTTAATNVTFPTAGTLTTTGNKLSVFAATTSSELAGVISDETGSGALVFANSPALVTPALGTPSSGTLTNCTIPVGSVTGTGVGVTAFLITPSSANLASAVTDETGSGALVFATSPSLTTPTLGVASATSINKVAFTAPATSATLTLANGSTLATSGANSLTLTTTAATNVTFPTAGTLTTTGNNLGVFAATTSSQLAGVISDETGSGALVFATSPSLTTPTLGVATATSINKVAFTAPATSATLTLADGSTLATSGANSLTLTTTAATNVTFPTAGTLTTTGNKLSVFSATTSAELAGVISDETGSGALVFATSPSLTTPTITSASALASGTYLTVKTHVTDDSSTSDFFIRGLTSTDVSKFSVDANGNLRATTKSFDIPHPTKEGMRLVYGVLEGPEHGVYHRGTVEGKGNLLIELPDYWSELVNEDFTVTLTPHGNYGVHIVEKALNSFIISLSGNIISKKLKTIKVDYLVHGSRKDAPLTIEQPE
jgi:hypothetical protein